MQSSPVGHTTCTEAVGFYEGLELLRSNSGGELCRNWFVADHFYTGPRRVPNRSVLYCRSPRMNCEEQLTSPALRHMSVMPIGNIITRHLQALRRCCRYTVNIKACIYRGTFSHLWSPRWWVYTRDLHLIYRCDYSYEAVENILLGE